MKREKINRLVRDFEKIFKETDYRDFVTALYIFMRYDNETYFSDKELETLGNMLFDRDSIFDEEINEEVRSMLDNDLCDNLYEEEDLENE